MEGCNVSLQKLTTTIEAISWQCSEPLSLIDHPREKKRSYQLAM